MNDDKPEPMLRVPYRIDTERLTLRCYDPADAEALMAVVNASLEHLRPWMPWATSERTSLDEEVELLRGFRGRFDLGQNFVFAICEQESEELVGGTGLHPRCGPGGLEIGYWVRVDRVRRGYATESARAMTRVAFELCRVAFVEICCDPANTASRRIPERLGFQREGVLRSRLEWPDHRRGDKEVWSLLADDYAASSAASAILEAKDSIGRRML